jgi:zinc protease
MRSELWLLALCVGCMPKIDRGPVPAQLATEPVRLVEQRAPTSPNVYLQAVLDLGSAYDPPGQEGLSALTVRSMVEAGAGERTGQQLRDALFEAGTGLSFVVDKEYASIRLKCHVDHADLCRSVFTDVLTAPTFRAEDVERLRDQALHAVGAGLASDTEALGEAAFHAILYEGHPYGHPVRGRAGVLPLLDADDVRTAWSSHVRRRSVVVGVAGAVDDAFVDALRSDLEAIPSGSAPELLLPAPNAPAGRGLVAVDTGAAGGSGVTGFHIGHPLAVDRSHEDWPALMVAMTAFGQHRQSFGRLYRVIRGARGLNYGDYAYAEPFVQRGWSSDPEQGVLRRDTHFSMWLRPTSDENGPFTLKLALSELESLVADGLTDEEVADASAYVARHIALEATDPGRRLAYALDAAVTGHPNVLELLPRVVGELEPSQVNAAIAEHLNPDTLWIVAVSGDAADLSARLTEETATPIVYADVTPDEAQSRRDAEVAASSADLDPDQVFVLPADGVFR